MKLEEQQQDNIPVIKGIRLSKDFKRDLARLKPEVLVSAEYVEVFHCLQFGKALPPKYKDHSLQGKLAGYRDCHIFSDLVLIYSVVDEVLNLVRLNTHSEIFK